MDQKKLDQQSQHWEINFSNKPEMFGLSPSLSAEKAEKELEKLNDKNKELVKEARKEREKILLEAKSISNSIKNTAKEEASKITDKMIEDAKKMIEGEKMSAIKEVKVLVASLSLDIAEKVIQKNLKNESSQQKLVSDLIDKIKIEKN